MCLMILYGRSVIGLGANADSEQFWEDAKIVNIIVRVK